jgi:hypothetical protein
MADEFAKLTWDELAGRSSNAPNENLVPVLIGLSAFGIACCYLYSRYLNDRFSKLESGQQGLKEDIDQTLQQNLNLEKKIIATNLRVDALKTVFDYTTNEYLTWYPTYQKLI